MVELSYLREFAALAQTCQFQETASQLFMSQSALSKHIKAIEKELGGELLIRSTRRVELSELGRAFLPYAQKIAQLQEEYTMTLLPDIQEQNRKVTIGAVPLATFYWLEGFMGHFSQRYPEYNVEFLERSDNKLREMLRRGECDIIIACEDPDGLDDEFCVSPYAYDSLVAVLPENHFLSGRESLCAGDIAPYPLIHLGSTNLTRYLDPSIQTASYVASRGAMLMDMVNRGMGVGILTYHAFKCFRKPGVCGISLCPPLKIRLNLLCVKQKRKNALILSTILDYMRIKGKDQESH